MTVAIIADKQSVASFIDGERSDVTVSCVGERAFHLVLRTVDNRYQVNRGSIALANPAYINLVCLGVDGHWTGNRTSIQISDHRAGDAVNDNYLA